MLRARLQLAFRFEDRDAGAFASDQRTRYVEAIFGQKLIEVVAGDAARNVREPLPNEV